MSLPLLTVTWPKLLQVDPLLLCTDTVVVQYLLVAIKHRSRAWSICSAVDVKVCLLLVVIDRAALFRCPAYPEHAVIAAAILHALSQKS